MNNNNRYRILIAGTNWPLQTFLCRLVEGLSRKNFSITLSGQQKPDKSWLETNHCRWLPAPGWRGSVILRAIRVIAGLLMGLHRSPFRLKIFIRSLKTEPAFFQKIQKLDRLLPFAREDWDLIYFPWNSAAIACLPVFQTGIPVALSCRGSQITVSPYNPVRSSLIQGLKETFHSAVGVHCVSRDILEKAAGFGLAYEKARVIHTPIDTRSFKPGQEEKDRQVLRLVSVGNLSWVKGFEYAITAVKALSVKGIPLSYTILGSGQDEQRIRYNIFDLDLDNQVTMMGSQPPESVLKQLQLSHIFLLSSLSEGIANAALEAMACEVPVVSFDCGGMKEVIENNVNGMLVPIRDVQAMAEAAEYLWNNPERRKELGIKARQTVQEDFNYEKQIADYNSFFNDCIQGHSPIITEQASDE